MSNQPKRCPGYRDRSRVMSKECVYCVRQIDRLDSDKNDINPGICIGPGITQPLFQIKPQDEAAKAFKTT